MTILTDPIVLAGLIAFVGVFAVAIHYLRKGYDL